MKSVNSLCLVIAMVISISGCTKKSSEPVIIHGSTTIEPVLLTLARSFEKQHNIPFEIEANGSRNGIRDLIEGKCDIADSSYHVTPSQVMEAEKEGVKLREFHIAFDMIVPIVHTENGLSSISMKHLRQIYAGEVANWKTLGWKDIPVMVVSRDDNSGTYHVWNKLVAGGGDAKPEHVETLSSNSAVVARVADNLSAIGYISKTFANSEIKVLAVNGIQPEKTIKRNAEYPIRRKLYVYVDMNNLDSNTRKFLLYMLSRQGHEVIKKEGFIPAGIYDQGGDKIRTLLSGEK